MTKSSSLIFLLLIFTVMGVQNCLADTTVRVIYNGSEQSASDALITAEVPGVGVTKKGRTDENGVFKTPIPLLFPGKTFRVSATLKGMTQSLSYSSPKKIPSEIVFNFAQPDVRKKTQPSQMASKEPVAETHAERGVLSFQMKWVVSVYRPRKSFHEALGDPVTNSDIKIRCSIDDDRPSAWISKNSGRTGQILMDDQPLTVHIGSVVHVQVADENERLLGEGSRQITRDIEGDSIALLVTIK